MVPKSQRLVLKEKLHSLHLVEGCYRRVRECLYWPNMNRDIRDYVCRKYEVLMVHEISERPWAKIGIDLFPFSELHGQFLED